jgi:LAGLIDADG endonuclease
MKFKIIESELYFNQWLAGLIDGDGHLGVSKKGYTSCEITIGIKDVSALILVKNKLGGSVKARSGSKSFRYRLHHKSGMVNLIQRINGHVHNTKRTPQLKRVCTILDIPYLDPIPITSDNAWYAGFFDADGTITAKFDDVSPSITISVSNKLAVDLEHFKIFNGNVYYDKSHYGHYFWIISAKDDILNICDYFKKHPSHSYKFKRLALIKNFYELKTLKAHKFSKESLYGKAWKNLKMKWIK